MAFRKSSSPAQLPVRFRSDRVRAEPVSVGRHFGMSDQSQEWKSLLKRRSDCKDKLNWIKDEVNKATKALKAMEERSIKFSEDALRHPIEVGIGKENASPRTNCSVAPLRGRFTLLETDSIPVTNEARQPRQFVNKRRENHSTKRVLFEAHSTRILEEEDEQEKWSQIQNIYEKARTVAQTSTLLSQTCLRCIYTRFQHCVNERHIFSVYIC